MTDPTPVDTGRDHIERVPVPNKAVNLALAAPDGRFKGGAVQGIDELDLGRAEDRDAVLLALLRAGAAGKASSATVRALTGVVKVAADDAGRRNDARIAGALTALESAVDAIARASRNAPDSYYAAQYAVLVRAIQAALRALAA
jgi:hypothetical protein